jgi:hypothetical protein
MALGGSNTLESGGRRGYCGVGVGVFDEGASSKTSRVGVASWNRLAREAGAGVRGTDAGNRGATKGGHQVHPDYRHLV